MQFSYVLKEELGIHARTAGLLTKEAGKFQSVITIINGEERADAKNILSLLALEATRGDTITVTIEGDDEENAASELERFIVYTL